MKTNDNAGRRTSTCQKETPRRFARHAELYGTDSVFETAEELGLNAVELGTLAESLRHTKPNAIKHSRSNGTEYWKPEPVWELTRAQRRRLLTRLDRLELADRTIQGYLGITQTALGSLRRDLSEAVGSPETDLTVEFSAIRQIGTPSVSRNGNAPCAGCGKPTRRRVGTRHCSNACRQAAYRERTAVVV